MEREFDLPPVTVLCVLSRDYVTVFFWSNSALAHTSSLERRSKQTRSVLAIPIYPLLIFQAPHRNFVSFRACTSLVRFEDIDFDTLTLPSIQDQSMVICRL
jgi:hypothetical protein